MAGEAQLEVIQSCNPFTLGIVSPRSALAKASLNRIECYDSLQLIATG